MTESVLLTPGVTVASLGPEHEIAYERFVALHPHALVTYTLRFRNLLCELLGCRARYAVALRGTTVAGVLPLMEMEGPHGRVLNSVPYFGSNGGPLTTDPEAHSALLSRYGEQLHDPTIAAGTMISNPLAPSAAPDHDFVEVRIGHVTTLPSTTSEDELLRIVDKSRRWDVRKAQRLGTRVAIENDAVSLLQEMHEQSMNAVGAEVKSPAFFVGLSRHFRAGVDYEIFVARLEDHPVASLLVFYTGRVVDYYMPALPPAYRAGQPMALVLKTAMLHAAARGCTHWNWGGSPCTNKTLQLFKSRWGGRPSEYRFWTKVNDPGLLSATAAGLYAAYPGFYVVPYELLAGGER